jgi:nitrite reductase/ring-hydroxylating ferredoxin subunit/uncharacterized membrane protein
MAIETPADAVERQEWLEPVETNLQKAVGAAYESAGPAGRHVKNFLHGVWLGHPLHPALIDVPLGAWTATLVLDIAGSRAADRTLTVGLVGAAGAAITGLTDWQATDGGARRIGVVHGLLNVAVATLYTFSLIERRRRNRSAGIALSSIGYGLSIAAAWLGGDLVYGKKIGVSHAQDEPVRDWTAVAEEHELTEGQPRRVSAAGVNILLLKRGDGIYAIGEICSHLGGPLAEGTIEGDTVVCPWHQSRFCLRDGSVVDGPATNPQPRFETRTRGGRIEIRSVARA